MCIRDRVYIAKKFDNTGVGVEDLISIGTIGLIKSINTFKPDKNIKLATYASRCIENEILMYLRRNSKTRMAVSYTHLDVYKRQEHGLDLCADLRRRGGDFTDRRSGGLGH